MILQNVGNYLPSITYLEIHLFSNTAVQTPNLVGDMYNSRSSIAFVWFTPNLPAKNRVQESKVKD
jgi:hypothetical protein